MNIMKQIEVEALEQILSGKGYSHLLVKGRGQHLIIYAQHPENKEPRLRLTALPGGICGLSFCSHSGKWERTPFVGSMQNILDTVENQFGWHLESL